MKGKMLISLALSTTLATLAGAFSHGQQPYKQLKHTYKSGNSAFQKGAKSKSKKIRSNRQKAKARKR